MFGDRYKSQGTNCLLVKKLCRSNAYEQTNFMDERMKITRRHYLAIKIYWLKNLVKNTKSNFNSLKQQYV